MKLQSIQFGIQRTRTRFPLLPFLVGVVMLAFAVAPADSFAFSFEKIEIKSKFGERFRAELDVVLEEDGEFQVKIGDKDDYRRLELERPGLIDDIEIVNSPENGERRRTLQVVSGRPLFFPSFHLVIRGTYKGGTLLENYLVTVDFQQNLALNVKNPKNKKPDESVSFPKKEVDLLQGGDRAEDLLASAGTQQEPAARDGKAKERGAPPATVQKPPPGIHSRVNAPTWMAKPPAKLQGGRGETAYFRGATWVESRAFPDKMPPMDPPQLSKKAEDAMPQVSSQESVHSAANRVPPEIEATPKPDATPGNDPSSTGPHYGPLARGENLFSIVKKTQCRTLGCHAGRSRSLDGKPEQFPVWKYEWDQKWQPVES